MHGKVSRIRHDNRGCFKDIPQGIKSIRYHSLSASHATLPDHLAITAVTEESGVIMAVRHRRYTLEAVQYHPESILSQGGDDLIRNFLSIRGGLWDHNPELNVLDQTIPPFQVQASQVNGASAPGVPSKIPSILEKIYQQRVEDVRVAQSTPGQSFSDLQSLLSLNIPPPLINFLDRLLQRSGGQPALLAEIKRASPSKGPISITTSAPSQALSYALAGAHTISVLTEPKWFLGSLSDMLHARLTVANLPNRPAILRKDFILSRYQVLESRIWGADTILLIVSMLPEALLRDLYQYSLELGMEPLVEVNNEKEMELALSLPAKVIGVNNRNLHDFKVDMGTTSRLSEMVKGKDVVLCALSGISTSQDVRTFAADGVGAVLIGESLMRAKDPGAFIRELFSIPEPDPTPQTPPLVKICGVRNKEEALAISEAGADMLGVVFAQQSKRKVDFKVAKEISDAIRSFRSASPAQPEAVQLSNAPWFTSKAQAFNARKTRPQLVGVFQGSSLSDILAAVAYCELDLVQLHGAEPVEWAKHIPVPVIRAFHIGQDNILHGLTQGGYHEFILLDSIRADGSGLSGGSGKVADLDLVSALIGRGEIVPNGASDPDPPVTVPAAISPNENGDDQDNPPDPVPSPISAKKSYPLPVILAGGLTPENIDTVIDKVNPWAVDVSGGVESEDGQGKDLEKVQLFINKVKGLKEASP